MTAPEDQPAPKAAAELPSYALDEEPEAGGWRTWLHGRKLVLTVVLLAIAAVVAFGAKPLYREAKARRALTMATEAGQAVDRGDAVEASRLLRQAALMAFQDKRVAARVTLHAARAGDMASVAELGKKLAADEAEPAEILVFGEMSLAAGRADDAERASGALADNLAPDETARATALRAGVLQARQRSSEAKELMGAAIATAPGESSDRLRLMLAAQLLAEKTANSAREAEELLEKASQNRGAQGAAALRMLCASRAGLSPQAQSDLQRTAERLRSHPASNDADEIFLARLALSADPTRSGDVARDLVARLGKVDADTDTRAAAARLLVSAGRLNEVLELVPEDEASKHAGALMVRLDALSGLEDWDGTSQLIEKNRGGALPDTLYHIFRARVASVRGNEEAAEEEKRILRQVMGFAEAPHVLFAARYAETIGWKPEALTAWRVLASNENARPDALRGQLRNLPPDTPASEGLAITRELLGFMPGDPSTRLSAAYFRLLANEQVEESSALAEEFLAANPESPDIRRVAALARLRTGKAGKGLEIWPADGEENRWRAVHVALLREAGKKKEAGIAAEQVDSAALGPEEKDLLSGRGDKPGDPPSP
ncbi:MAG: hypothetical protein JHD33_05905 [Chthoniobacterales bacterium]|nr:hypothetical protein [Chthoniobacterales bacterium]